MASFVLSFFPLDVLDEILDLIESVSEGFLTYYDVFVNFKCCMLDFQVKRCSSPIPGHIFFCSSEHKVLIVGYCDQSISVIHRPSSTICFKSQVLLNHSANENQTSPEYCLGGSLLK